MYTDEKWIGNFLYDTQVSWALAGVCVGGWVYVWLVSLRLWWGPWSDFCHCSHHGSASKGKRKCVDKEIFKETTREWKCPAWDWTERKHSGNEDEEKKKICRQRLALEVDPCLESLSVTSQVSGWPLARCLASLSLSSSSARWQKSAASLTSYDC